MEAILTISLEKYNPLKTRNGTYLYKNVRAIQNFIDSNFKDFRIELSSPRIPERSLNGQGEARWFTNEAYSLRSLDNLSSEVRMKADSHLDIELKKMDEWISKLHVSRDKDEKYFAEVLQSAFTVPNPTFIYVDETATRFVFALWGFELKKGFGKKHTTTVYGIKALRKKITQKSKKSSGIVSPSRKTNKNNTTYKSINKDISIQQNEEIQPENFQEPRKESNCNLQQSSPCSEEKTGVSGSWDEFSSDSSSERLFWKKSWTKRLLFTVIVLVLIYILLKWTDHPETHLKNALETTPLPPIDTTQIGIDPDDPTGRLIFKNRLNVALDKGVDLQGFLIKADSLLPDMHAIFFDTSTRLIQYEIPDNDLKRWGDELNKLPDVRLIFNDALVIPSYIPTDPGFRDPKINWYFDRINVYNAWNFTTGDQRVVVAIVDNGFDLTHPELQGKVVKPRNIPNGNSNLFPPGGEKTDHGTHVAATAVGNMDNGEGISGIAPKCLLMPIQVADNHGQMSTLYVVMGILYAIHQGADVINLSLGMSFPKSVSQMPVADQQSLLQQLYIDEALFWAELYDFALENNIVIVQAAGNENMVSGLDPMHRSNKTIVVSALDAAERRASFSNFGQHSTVSAPGTKIYSAIPGGSYDFLQGTSMASPIVAGAVAVMRSFDQTLTPLRIRNILVHTGKNIPSGTSDYVGPLIQLDKVFELLGDSAYMPFPDQPRDLSFAYGDWLCDNQLKNSHTLERITLYFHLPKSGKMVLQLLEEDGNDCSCELNVNLQDNKLYLTQSDTLICKDNSKYQSYSFTCFASAGKRAKCIGYNLQDSSVISFHLVKYK
ncbi:S8 family serine peptidase [Fulvivirgaceae bacterium BMA12]|uniref:S8 family serine peptidase n=1 Tax=Agaribacillus aureus TaxID=3051825 RepID=A0ABT8LAC4_9BACT|nr:S8 family serine peptidase [Fulvivirgaceae bacterium BMA12]